MKRSLSLIVMLTICAVATSNAYGAVAGPVLRETAEFILKKFGKGIAGQTVEEVAEATAKVATKYGDEAVPLLRNAGHSGFTAIKEAGEQAPDVIKLYAKKGDEAIWVISEPKKLSIFLKHGDNAADALIKHPGIADTLIGKFGDDSVIALNKISKQSAQRLGMVADEGLLNATAQSPALLKVIGQYGDSAMDFIWKNKGALAVTALLVKFLDDPQVYISGAKELVVEPLLKPIVQNTNWTLIVGGIIAALGLIIFMRRLGIKSKLTN